MQDLLCYYLYGRFLQTQKSTDRNTMKLSRNDHSEKDKDMALFNLDDRPKENLGNANISANTGRVKYRQSL